MLAIISDIHANLAALEAVLADIDARGISEIWCLGDVVGYNGEPNECISLLSQRGIPSLLGNHDSYIVSGKNCTRSRVVAEIIDDHVKMISEENLAWLAQASDRFERGRDLFVHGGPEDPLDQYIYNVAPSLFPEQVDRLFVGHTHVQCVLKMGHRVFCNPGSVGQPRDGDPRAAYVTLEGDDIICHRVQYDVARTVAAMQARGYEPFKYENLWTGTQIGGRIDKIVRSEAD
ncbi:metallophosphatase family protein [bacterium]|nr:metallophosphatase family protein [bacterium]